MPRKRTRQLTAYLLPEELRTIRLAAASADSALSSFVRDIMLKHIAESDVPATKLQKASSTPG